jgi:hypothetical protein
MAAASHNPNFAKKAGIPVSVAKEFNQADKGKKFKEGGNVANLKKLFKGKDTYKEELKEGKAIKSGKLTPQQYAKGERMEDSKKMKAGDKKMKDGGSCYAKGGVTRADGCATKGHTKGKMMAEGGRVGRGGVKGDNVFQSAKDAISKGHSNIPEMMRRKTAEESDAGKGEGILQKLRSPYQSGEDTEYNKRNSAVQKKAEDEYKNTKSDMAASALGIKSKPSVKVDTRDMDYGNRPNDVPDAVIKKTEIVKTAPVVSKPKNLTEGQKARDQIARMRDIYSSDPEFTGDKDLPKPSELKDTDFKKGGMTKRPPKPAKKVPARKFASGGSTSRSSASSRGDGCATKGHTKGKYL